MEPSCNTGGGDTMAHQLAPRHPKADSVVQRLKPFMAMKPAKRDLIGLRLCADFVSLKT